MCYGVRQIMHFCFFLDFSPFLSVSGVDHLVSVMQSKNPAY